MLLQDLITRAFKSRAITLPMGKTIDSEPSRFIEEIDV
jgi:hypothetical protein